jgi:hypothetical protein
MEPDAGVHATVTGATPPVTVGAGNVTVALRPVVLIDWLAGQETFGPSTGLLGPMGGSPPHAEDRRAATSALDASHEL